MTKPIKVKVRLPGKNQDFIVKDQKKKKHWIKLADSAGWRKTDYASNINGVYKYEGIKIQEING